MSSIGGGEGQDDHATEHQEGGEDAINVESLPTGSATAGEVPKANGTGGVQMADHGPDWEEDPSSPLVVSNSTSGTINLTNTYEQVKCVFVKEGGIQANDVHVQVNGATGSYDYTNRSGSSFSSNSSLPLGFDYDLFCSGELTISVHDTGNTYGLYLDWSCPGWEGEAMMGGDNTTVTTPVSSITLLNPGGFGFNAKMHVYGWNP